MISIKPVGRGYVPLTAAKPKQSSLKSTTEVVVAENKYKTTKKSSAAVPGTSEYENRRGGISPLDGKFYPRVNKSATQYYKIPEESASYVLKRTFKNGPYTQTWFNYPAGDAVGNKLKKILTPEEYDMSLVATAEASYSHLTQEVAALLPDLELELIGTKINPIPMEEREWYKDPAKFGLINVEWVDSPEKKTFAETAGDTNVDDSSQRNEKVLYTPRQDFLKIAIEAKDNLQNLINVATNLEGEDRALVLDFLAGNGDWSEMRGRLRKIDGKTAQESLDYVIDLKKNAYSLQDGVSPLRPKWEIKPAYEHPSYVKPNYQTRV